MTNPQIKKYTKYVFYSTFLFIIYLIFIYDADMALIRVSLLSFVVFPLMFLICARIYNLLMYGKFIIKEDKNG